MSVDLRRQADWLAGAGYLAAAPDLFYYGGTLRCPFATMRQAMAREGDTLDDIATARTSLQGQARATGRVGIIGFCLGGGLAVLMASGHCLAASSVDYGMVPNDALELLADACPIVGSYGARDRGLKDDPERFRQTLDTWHRRRHQGLPPGLTHVHERLPPRWAGVLDPFAQPQEHAALHGPRSWHQEQIDWDTVRPGSMPHHASGTKYCPSASSRGARPLAHARKESPQPCPAFPAWQRSR